MNTEFEIGDKVELLDTVSLMFSRVRVSHELLFPPGTIGTVIPCHPALTEFVMIKVDDWPLVVSPHQITLVKEEIMEAE